MWPDATTSASASAGVAVRGSQTTPSRGTITVVMLRSPRSRAPVSSWWATSSIRPSSREAPEHHGELVGRRRGGELVAGLDAEQPHAGVRQAR